MISKMFQTLFRWIIYISFGDAGVAFQELGKHLG